MEALNCYPEELETRKQERNSLSQCHNVSRWCPELFAEARCIPEKAEAKDVSLWMEHRITGAFPYRTLWILKIK